MRTLQGHGRDTVGTQQGHCRDMAEALWGHGRDTLGTQQDHRGTPQGHAAPSRSSAPLPPLPRGTGTGRSPPLPSPVARRVPAPAPHTVGATCPTSSSAAVTGDKPPLPAARSRFAGETGASCPGTGWDSGDPRLPGATGPSPRPAALRGGESPDSLGFPWLGSTKAGSWQAAKPPLRPGQRKDTPVRAP